MTTAEVRSLQAVTNRNMARGHINDADAGMKNGEIFSRALSSRDIVVRVVSFDGMQTADAGAAESAPHALGDSSGVTVETRVGHRLHRTQPKP